MMFILLSRYLLTVTGRALPLPFHLRNDLPLFYITFKLKERGSNYINDKSHFVTMASRTIWDHTRSGALQYNIGEHSSCRSECNVLHVIVYR
ncbi:uncharacterized protein EI90DRAFT_3089578 [Cantharellus anzutake]|uniref:uncharacterized protein n=1 Tax=Cantharellus anzutake TaxID=1750568 RepID=UPI0019071BD1|nr:uncharacterized protein EI90DRAFT_3089578 [Cantharellus anzutake]KAF8314598.1 hypothetical protein EI90DRAFT_3089578 [Cantharellus anzutake]